MDINVLPIYDMSDNPTNCCPRFQTEGWDEQELHFKDKLFVKAKTRSIFHIPLNMGSVYPQTFKAIEDARAVDMSQVVVLSHDPSAWRGEHLFAVTKEVPGQEMVRMTGDFMTKVFEGPYKNVPRWEKEMQAFVESKGKQVKKHIFSTQHAPNVRNIMVKIMWLLYR